VVAGRGRRYREASGGTGGGVMAFDWWSIEVRNGEFPATQWRRSHGEALVEAAMGSGATNWAWHELPWGVVLELEFADERHWAAFRDLPALRAALDAVPDPVNGVLVYPGRGGMSGEPHPRRPRPMPVAGAAALPIPEDPPVHAGKRGKVSRALKYRTADSPVSPAAPGIPLDPTEPAWPERTVEPTAPDRAAS
jgi:hypothetical protein